jgi:hypothetical protein
MARRKRVSLSSKILPGSGADKAGSKGCGHGWGEEKSLIGPASEQAFQPQIMVMKSKDGGMYTYRSAIDWEPTRSGQSSYEFHEPKPADEQQATAGVEDEQH